MEYRIIDPREYSTEEIRKSLLRLPVWRREEAERFKHEQGRRECTLSYLLLTEMMGFQPTFTKGEHGKPEIAEKEGTFFNLSHCKNAIACVVDDSPCGIDVECLGRYKPVLAEYCMNEDELQMIATAEDPDAIFTMLWTRKEALLKLTGEGITDDLKSCLTSYRMNGVVIESGVNEEKGYAWAVARRRPSPTLP